MTMIEMSKPYIYIESLVQEQENLKVSFTVNGCASIDQIHVEVNGVELEGLPEDGYCNHLVPIGGEQTVFTIAVKPTDTVVLTAVVD